MKKIKITLAIFIVGVIIFFIFKWDVIFTPPPPIKPGPNQFTEKIENEIQSLVNLPINTFSPQPYSDILYLIDDYHKKGFLGISYSNDNVEINNQNHNDQWREIFLINLYSAYAPKFIEQAMFVFKGSKWSNADLSFIRNEVLILQASPYLTQNSPVTNSFNEIRSILAKYDEIASFIASNNSFPDPNYSLNVSFPDLSDRIKRSRKYLANNLDNPYVNNCARLREGLQGIPRKLFYKHVSYLSRKINENGGRFTEFEYQAEYSNAIFTPLRNQLDALNNQVYGIGNNTFNNAYNSLDNLLIDYNIRAFEYFTEKAKLQNQ